MVQLSSKQAHYTRQDEIALQCAVQGMETNERVIVKWWKDEQVILEQPEFLPEDGVFLMTFSDPNEEDIGDYTCVIIQESVGIPITSNVLIIQMGL